jgi:nesprin-1
MYFAMFQSQRVVLSELTRNLEELGVSHEQLKECVSPGDVKMLSQRVWLLWQQHGDCEHQLALLCHHLEEKLALSRMFDTR